ncbi:FadR/GntR family transcriptional regulator [Streptomyces sp. NRRL S-1022]|uniref:FadR/GntR family transcriptional regulator n=1 Tax=Streptomyces sp. NRRL S-1022 TaxID=1463880 RepID=UPI0018FE7E8D|nr:GntR family transcriptional regulator [Streptomyces sp. NRRL S-1022]
MSDNWEDRPMALRPIARLSTAREVIALLHRELASGAWPIGSRIPSETELAAELGVSRPTIREAVSALVHTGMLEAQRGKGVFVRSVSDPAPMLQSIELADVRDVFEVQLGFDVQAAHSAAQRRTSQDMTRLWQLLRARAEAAGRDDAEFGERDAALHLAVVEAAHNVTLTECYRFFVRRLQESLDLFAGADTHLECGTEAHEALVQAIDDQDSEAAAAAARHVVRTSLHALEGLLAVRAAEPPATPPARGRGGPGS